MSRRDSPSLSGDAAVYRKGDADNQVGAGLHSQGTAAAISSPAEAAERVAAVPWVQSTSPLAVMSATIGVPGARLVRHRSDVAHVPGQLRRALRRLAIRRRLPKRVD